MKHPLDELILYLSAHGWQVERVITNTGCGRTVRCTAGEFSFGVSEHTAYGKPELQVTLPHQPGQPA